MHLCQIREDSPVKSVEPNPLLSEQVPIHSVYLKINIRTMNVSFQTNKRKMYACEVFFSFEL